MKKLLLISLMLCSACEPPPVVAGADNRQRGAQNGRIEGTVVVNSVARGKIVLFLYDASRPPPPVGTGRPITFTVVSQDSIFGAAADGDAGPFTAPFAFSLVAPGRYLIRGFIDNNDDFIPWYGVTADTTAGDVGGAAIDPVSRLSRIIEVGMTEAGTPIPALDVPVSFADTTRLPFDRPIFSVVGGAEQVTVSAPFTMIELQATPVVEGVMQQQTPAFLLRLIDDNNDGMPDDANGDGIPEMWPRVVVRKLAPERSPLLDENDLDKNGIVDAEGTDYEHMDGTTDGKPDVVVLAAGFNIMEYQTQLFDSMGRVKQTPTPVPRLKLVIRPLALDASNPLAPAPLRTLPVGDYAITVIQQTGQTWRVPNELAPGIADALNLPVIASQSFIVQTR
ncbi:MAG: hypothetical protein JNM17_35160 [Archangium sp.]|nr:hypothetical protein [Archangium sp.]